MKDPLGDLLGGIFDDPYGSRQHSLTRLAAKMQRTEGYVQARALGLILAVMKHADSGGTVVFRDRDGTERVLKVPS